MSWTAAKVGYGRRPVRLVQAIGERGAEQLGSAGGDRGSQQPRVSHVERGVLVRYGVRQHRTSSARRKLLDRRYHDCGKPPCGFEPRATCHALVRPAHGEAAEQRGRDVVGMTLQLGRELEHPLGTEVGLRQRRPEQEPTDDRRRGRPQPAPGGHVVGAADLGAKLGVPGFGESPRHRDGGQVRSVGRERARARADDVDLPLGGQLGLEAIVQVEREPEAVVARTEVGRGRRYENGCAHWLEILDANDRGDRIDGVQRLDLGERGAHG